MCRMRRTTAHPSSIRYFTSILKSEFFCCPLVFGLRNKPLPLQIEHCKCIRRGRGTKGIWTSKQRRPWLLSCHTCSNVHSPTSFPLLPPCISRCCPPGPWPRRRGPLVTFQFFWGHHRWIMDSGESSWWKTWGLFVRRRARLTGLPGQHSPPNYKTGIQETNPIGGGMHWHTFSAPAALLPDFCHLSGADNTSRFSAEGSRAVQDTVDPSQIHSKCR